MLERGEIQTLPELLRPIAARKTPCSVFVRLYLADEETLAFLPRYAQAAKACGRVVRGRYPNPDAAMLSRVRTAAGNEVDVSLSFLREKAAACLPFCPPRMVADIAVCLKEALGALREEGKPDTAIFNAYLKLLCWLSADEKLLRAIGEGKSPKVLYIDTALTQHEWLYLRLLRAIGADVLLAELGGKDFYLALDRDSAHCQLFMPEKGQPLPADWTLPKAAPEKPTQRPATPAVPTLSVGRSPAQQPAPVKAPEPAARSASAQKQREVDPFKYVRKPRTALVTNTWMREADWHQLLTPPEERGERLDQVYNLFLRVRGAEDSLTYPRQMYQLCQRLRASGRPLVTYERELSLPTAEEVAAVRRRNYTSAGEMIVDLSANLPRLADEERQRELQYAFVALMAEEAKRAKGLRPLLNTAVRLLCWLRRDAQSLFPRGGSLAAAVRLGGCKTGDEALYFRLLSMLRADVALFLPDPKEECLLKDERLAEIRLPHSASLERIPTEEKMTRVETDAARAQQELDSLMYEGTGLYRPHQYQTARTVALKTTLDELFLLWNTELQYRPHFAGEGGEATLPVLYAKISGVDRAQGPQRYWQRVASLLGEDTVLCTGTPLFPGDAPQRELAQRCVQRGRLNRKALLADPKYPFRSLRQETQDLLLDRLDWMLAHKVIRGTGENGMEYTVAAAVLGLRKDLLRLAQKFDFTRKNPKLLCVLAKEETFSAEDAARMVFLHLIGFDAVQFVPTGCQTAEYWLRDCVPVEHQLGEYIYDMAVPDLAELRRPGVLNWLNSLWRKV